MAAISGQLGEALTAWLHQAVVQIEEDELDAALGRLLGTTERIITDEHVKAEVQSSRNALDGEDRRCFDRAALDLGQRGVTETGFVAQLLLRQAASFRAAFRRLPKTNSSITPVATALCPSTIIAL